MGILNKKGKDLESENAIDIDLIPKILKILNPTNLVNFRPISLFFVLYKLVAKVLANRLQGAIGRCIDNAQSAFFLGRLIFDNVLLAYELLHTFRKNRTRKKRDMVVKLDMRKAYCSTRNSTPSPIRVPRPFQLSIANYLSNIIPFNHILIN